MVISRSDTTSCGLTQFYLLTALSVYMASSSLPSGERFYYIANSDSDYC